MKKIAFILAFSTGCVLHLAAQTPQGGNSNNNQQGQYNNNQQGQGQNNGQGQQNNKTPEDKAQKQTQEMTSQLGLSQTQQQQVYNLNLSKINQTNAIKAKYNGDMQAAQPELKPVHEQYKTNLNTILTPDQAAKWEQIKQQEKQQHQQQQNQSGSNNNGGGYNQQQGQGQN